MMTTAEVHESAVKILSELDDLRDRLEHSGSSPYVKSHLAREISESRARIGQVIRECAPVPAA
jgi:hypothetical protein